MSAMTLVNDSYGTRRVSQKGRYETEWPSVSVRPCRSSAVRSSILRSGHTTDSGRCTIFNHPATKSSRVLASAGNKCSTRSDSTVMSSGQPKVVNDEKNRNSPCLDRSRAINSGVGARRCQSIFATCGFSSSIIPRNCGTCSASRWARSHSSAQTSSRLTYWVDKPPGANVARNKLNGPLDVTSGRSSNPASRRTPSLTCRTFHAESTTIAGAG